ncbi:MAG TPA: aminotransferase class V-fold PLP-dependent enzyme [Acidimicrobiia bacterium]|nr:aminotransferase class V-fold PLP-dependent enzyme [Acidimicrobiia bacterium]
MDRGEFRRAGHETVDWIADYLERVGDLPVLSQSAPGDIRASLPSSPPSDGESWDSVLKDLDDLILPGITHWQSPNFFAYFPANSSGPSVLGDFVAAGLGTQGMLWATSPAMTELETLVLDWLVEMCGLPSTFASASTGGGVIQDSASSATLVAMLAARERATHGQANRHGTGGDLTAYTSVHGHSSIDKAVRIAGYGSQRLRHVGVDQNQAMDPDDLEQAIIADKAEGLTPSIVVATIGTTASTAIDPVAEIAEVAQAHGLWLHVDAAYAGTAAVLPDMRWILDGLDAADSYVFNPHKWMLTNFDCSAFYVADRSALIQTLSILPEYLKNQATASGAVIDYRDWQIPLGRRFRALKLWFVIRSYGVEGIRRHVRRGIDLAQELAGWVDDDPDFELAAPHPFGLVCLRHRGGDEVNQRIVESVNSSGEAYVTHAVIDDAYTIRVAIGAPTTTRRHVADLWDRIKEAATGRDP